MIERARVLLVEDEEIVRKILATIIGELGHDVRECEDAESALSLVHEETFDLLITDKNLPNMNGLELMHHARALSPDIELVMITGYASYESALEALRMGVADYMEKPFLDLAVIQKRMQGILERRRGLVDAPPVTQAERLVKSLEDAGARAPAAALPAARQLLGMLRGSPG